MSTVTPLMTVEDLEQFPDDCHLRELWRGQLITALPSGPDHSRICAQVCAILFQFVCENDLGRVFINNCGYLLAENPDTLLGADVSFITKNHLSQICKHRGFFLGPPDLVVEVIAPDDQINCDHKKAQEYINFGALEAWVVNPRDRTVMIYTQTDEPVKLANSDILMNRSLLPGFECAVSDLIGEMLFDK